MEVVLNELAVSDLFFNHDMPELREAYAEEDGSPELIQEALKKEAGKFSELLGGQVSTEWLMDNYNARV